MIAILIVAVFAAAALGSVLVIADSAVRGRNAFRQLHGRLAQFEAPAQVSIRFEEFGARPALPVLRQRALNAARPARRPVRSPLPSLHAAA